VLELLHEGAEGVFGFFHDGVEMGDDGAELLCLYYVRIQHSNEMGGVVLLEVRDACGEFLVLLWGVGDELPYEIAVVQVLGEGGGGEGGEVELL
jgi:hypothetical protein